jgi:hypothetical protein
MELNRNCYGFEIKKNFCKEAREKMLVLDYDYHKELQEQQEKGQMALTLF